MPEYAFLKGHGTENDFVLLPDHDGSVHGDLSDAQMAERVRALCDRRAGIGGDGVLRAVLEGEQWFMDYRNADGSVSEMCGNGIRVFARHLVEEGLADPSGPIPIGTRDGVKTLLVDGDLITAELGSPRVLGESKVAVSGHAWVARHVDMGNPHAVAFVDSLDDAGPLLEAPEHDAATYPDGVNVELSYAAATGTSRCASTSAARARPAPAARVRARWPSRRRWPTTPPAVRRTASTSRAGPCTSCGPRTTAC